MVARLDRRKTKLTWEQVDEIRELYQTTALSLRKIGGRFSVSGNAVRFIVSEAHWKPENDPRHKV